MITQQPDQREEKKRQDYNGLFVQCKIKPFSKTILKCYLGGSNYMPSAVQILKITVQYLKFLWHSNLRNDGIVCWMITNILEEHTDSVKVTNHQTKCCHTQRLLGLFLHSVSAVIVTLFYDWSQVINFCAMLMLYTKYTL